MEHEHPEEDGPGLGALLLCLIFPVLFLIFWPKEMLTAIAVLFVLSFILGLLM